MPGKEISKDKKFNIYLQKFIFEAKKRISERCTHYGEDLKECYEYYYLDPEAFLKEIENGKGGNELYSEFYSLINLENSLEIVRKIRRSYHFYDSETAFKKIFEEEDCRELDRYSPKYKEMTLSYNVANSVKGLICSIASKLEGQLKSLNDRIFEVMTIDKSTFYCNSMNRTETSFLGCLPKHILKKILGISLIKCENLTKEEKFLNESLLENIEDIENNYIISSCFIKINEYNKKNIKINNL